MLFRINVWIKKRKTRPLGLQFRRVAEFGVTPAAPLQESGRGASVVELRRWSSSGCQADTWQTDKLDIYFCTESPCF